MFFIRRTVTKMFLLPSFVAVIVLPIVVYGWGSIVASPTSWRRSSSSSSCHDRFSITCLHQHSPKTIMMEHLKGVVGHSVRSSPPPRGAPPHSHILVLPGFGTETSDYTRRDSLAPNLVRRGWDESRVHVLPVTRFDWIATLVNGALDSDFLHGAASPARPAYFWYLQRVAREIQRIDQQVKKEYGEEAKAKIIIVGHSAGGWLAR
jgi:hypothetical protein